MPAHFKNLVTGLTWTIYDEGTIKRLSADSDYVEVADLDLSDRFDPIVAAHVPIASPAVKDEKVVQSGNDGNAKDVPGVPNSGASSGQGDPAPKPAPAVDLTVLSFVDLKAYATKNGIDIKGCNSTAKVLEAISKAGL